MQAAWSLCYWKTGLPALLRIDVSKKPTFLFVKAQRFGDLLKHLVLTPTDTMINFYFKAALRLRLYL